MTTFYTPEDDQHGGDPPREASTTPLNLSPEQAERITALAKEYHQPVSRYFLRATRDPHKAQDLTQEVHVLMCRVIAKGKTFSGNPIAYAMQTAKNVLISHVYRKRVVELPVEEVGDAYTAWLTQRGDADPTAASVRFVELLHEVKSAIGNEAEIEVWEYRVLWGLSGVEVAELLGVSGPTVSRRFKAAVTKAGGVK
ncbi:sigma-70 family RNA polymerase sigma factor [Streptomyces lunaelactis]|uniref:sigma-70 family RNA polymerase sigma factor n=1 Tax=Streptomyces lunaelactis TaxID=1535768 RepID=UPI001585793E|nr:sigma-70 family RNA polymerase sigma factor [Streptomyces lunaelactis]